MGDYQEYLERDLGLPADFMQIKEPITPTARVGSLKRLLDEEPFAVLIGVEDGLGARTIDYYHISDGLWAGSFTISAKNALPDTDTTAEPRLGEIGWIMSASTSPILIDGDNGGTSEQFASMVKTLEERGASGIIIEDKTGEKKNSLIEGAEHTLEDTQVFSDKIKAGIAAKQNPDFMVIARLEELIAGRPMGEAVERAIAFLEAGADGIMIHSKSKSPAEVIAFARIYQKLPKQLTGGKVLVCVPTTYGENMTAADFAREGFQVIIYANQLLRLRMAAEEDALSEIRKGHWDPMKEEKWTPRLSSVEEIMDLVNSPGVNKKT